MGKLVVAVELCRRGTLESRIGYLLYADRDCAEFDFREGNMSCDCSRAIVFAHWAGEPLPIVKCNAGYAGAGEYSARLTDSTNGEVFYADGRIS